MLHAMALQMLSTTRLRLMIPEKSIIVVVCRVVALVENIYNVVALDVDVHSANAGDSVVLLWSAG